MLTRWTNVVLVAMTVLLAAGCAALQTEDLEQEKQILEALRAYEMAVASYDAQAAMDLFTEDYEGWRGGGRESVGRMVEGMAERESAYELDLSKSVVKVEGDAATVEGVAAVMGRWNMTSTYVLTRTNDGWKISDIQFQR